ncbi:ABC transporter permease subunit [bacterium BMS3Abin03]|nr:ABC transporter permease subunit [bacterium BMS3Abin03]
MSDKRLEIKKKKAAHKRAVFFDKLAKYSIYAGGIAVIIAITGILAFIVVEAYPLFSGADGNEKAVIKEGRYGLPVLTGIDEYQEIAYIITDSASVDFIRLESKTPIKKIVFKELNNRTVLSASADMSKKHVALGLDSGKVALINIDYNITFDENDNRIITPEVSLVSYFTLDSTMQSITNLEYQVDEDGNPSLGAVTRDGRFLFYSKYQEQSLFGEGEVTEYKYDLSDDVSTRIKTLAMDSECRKLMAGDEKGSVYYFDISDKANPRMEKRLIVLDNSDVKLTAIKFILGDQSLIVGTSDGKVSSWMKVNEENTETGWKWVKAHTFEQHSAAITTIAPSTRNKCFFTASSDGEIKLHYLTSEKMLLSINEYKIPVKYIEFSPKADGAIILYKDGLISNYKIDDPHPEVTLYSLFGKVWYEGYKQPEYVWQSTGGTDEFEPKFSLVPLIIGTLKGTFYAMIFAIPLSLLGALYLSTFSHPNLRNKVKPIVELLAALPSVVIGFLAGLWFAPLLERILPGVLLMLIVLPITVIIGVSIWRYFPKMRLGLKGGYEVLFLIPLVILGVMISIELSPWFESFLFGGDYRVWLFDTLNTNYDQRNSIVVGFAMGFAVIPIIFTICEDALSSVPQHLTSASLALGATKWQTSIRVVLPTASPGIFSAIMIGLGRAVGETMIVLMATGNTPILSFSPFNGFRTLSANIAVEIPEAPYHGTLYRVLFVSAVLLFLLTFLVNTVAEVVRQRLRKKYMHI